MHLFAIVTDRIALVTLRRTIALGGAALIVSYERRRCEIAVKEMRK